MDIHQVSRAVLDMIPWDRNDFFRFVKHGGHLPLSWYPYLDQPDLWFSCDDKFQDLLLVLYPQFAAGLPADLGDPEWIEWLDSYDFHRR